MKRLLFPALLLLGSSSAFATHPCVDDFIQRLEIDLDMKTTPALLVKILREDMLLDDLPPAVALLGSKLTRQEPLRPLLERIREGVSRTQPAVVQFLCAAIQRGLIPRVDDGARAALTKTIHHTFLLEELTKAMIADHNFMEGVYAHLMKKREELGIRTPGDVRRLTGGIFEAAKTASIDVGMLDLLTLRQRGRFLRRDRLLWKYGLDLNIVEAATTEWENGFRDNARAGLALLGKPIREMRVVEPARTIEFELSAEWTRLYETWNLAFITANVKHPGLLFPKLLIPQILWAKPDEYIFRRVLALWTSIDFYLFAEVRKTDDAMIPRSRELADLWGEINRPYADALF